LFLAESTPITALYRFVELFDLKNIPKSELIMYAAKKGRVALTPPMKPWLEEKMAFALLHHPVLEPFWSHELGADTYELLHRWMPKTWILDPRPIPPHAVIPGLTADGRSVSDWKALATLGQKGRRFVIKPSGFSELGGILATVCPLDKKLIHGMREAVMAPCALAEPAPER